jgi:hypothetical protein
MLALLAILGIAFVLSWAPVIVIFLRTRRWFAGERIVRCPETKHVAVIRLDTTHAAATTMTGDPDLRVESCSRWDGPVGHCEEGCVGGTEALPLRVRATGPA